MNRIHRFPKGTSCGHDGLRAQHLMDILGGAASVVSDDLLGSITGVVNLFLSGKCPSELGEFIASAPLTPLVKPGGGLLPIVVGTVWRRLVSKETRARCPSIAPWVEFCYSRPARLYYEDSILWSCQGVQQGDPLGPLLFALALHPLVQKINQSCELTLQAWYLDDGTIVGDTLMVVKALDIIRCDGPNRGLFLNVDKTELFWPVEDPRGRVEGVFPINISCPLNGVKLLGGSVSLDAQVQFDKALHALLEKIVTASGPGFSDWQWRLSTLPIHLGGLSILSAGDIIQYTFLASRLHTSNLQADILLKTCIVSYGFQNALDAFNHICNVDILFITTSASAPQMMKTLAKCYFGAIEKDLVSRYELSPRHVAILSCIRAPYAQYFFSPSLLTAWDRG
ncbi:putative reverse transcriptase domain-containing protein [Tanacetum coccineum]